MKQNKEDVKQNLNKENLLQKYRTTEPGLEINNKYYTFFPVENNEHIIIFETSLNEKTNELKTSIVGITSKLIFKEITNKLNI